jgi:hypothetical protein
VLWCLMNISATPAVWVSPIPRAFVFAAFLPVTPAVRVSSVPRAFVFASLLPATPAVASFRYRLLHPSQYVGCVFHISRGGWTASGG